MSACCNDYPFCDCSNSSLMKMSADFNKTAENDLKNHKAKGIRVEIELKDKLVWRNPIPVLLEFKNESLVGHVDLHLHHDGIYASGLTLSLTHLKGLYPALGYSLVTTNQQRTMNNITGTVYCLSFCAVGNVDENIKPL